MPGKKSRVPDGTELLYDRYIKGDREQERLYEEDRKRMQLGVRIRELRLSAGLTQAELARRTGTTASAISRIESADYKNHSLPLLQKIAIALHQRLEVRFVDENASAPEYV